MFIGELLSSDDIVNLISWFDVPVESKKFEYLSIRVLLCVFSISND
jgi:hypothetical protein